METIKTEAYNDGVVRWFIIVSVFCLLLVTLSGIFIAVELAWPILNFDVVVLLFSKMRLLHSKALFVFGSYALMASFLYSVQRTCQVRLWSDVLGWLVFWGWGLLVVYGVDISRPEPFYIHMELYGPNWQFEVALIALWVALVLNFVMTVVARKTARVHVSNWFFIGLILMIAGLYVVRFITVPAPTDQSISQMIAQGPPYEIPYSMIYLYLTMGGFGVLYYLIPVRVSRPLFSRILAFTQCCALLFVFIWQGLLHVKYPGVPDGSTELGEVMAIGLSLALLGGALNGVLSFSGVWSKLRTDYILRFALVALVFFAVSIVFGSSASVLPNSGRSIYTDWTVGNDHLFALGWIAMAVSGVLYHIVEESWNTGIYSSRLVKLHFWMFVIGTVVYTAAIWLAGIVQGLVWRSYDEYGALAYTFAESVEAMHPYYIMRVVGGLIFGIGVLLMLYNTLMTILQSRKLLGATAAEVT